MGENLNGNDALVARVQQLENERDELHKDIEQLCLQNSGPGYLAAATRMHFQRTAALEQDIENLKMKLASCMRENTNLREELSEAYQIKSQLADLHSAEVSKNMEAEKQVNFFQNCVAAAFAERDQSIIEAEKAKEKLDIMKQKLNDWEKRAEKLNNEFLEEKKISVAVRSELEKQEKLNENFKKVVNKFYEIRQQHITSDLNGISWEDKCDCLLKDTEDTWSFNDYSTPTYINALEEEVEILRKSVDNLQSRQRMGLEIETHLKKKVIDLEKKVMYSQKFVVSSSLVCFVLTIWTSMQNLTEERRKGLSELLHYHSQHRRDIINLLDEGFSHLKSITICVEEKIKQYEMNREQKSSTDTDMSLHENECRDVHVNYDAPSDLVTELSVPVSQNTISDMSGDIPQALSQALQEKVATLLLLSQEEERSILESNVNVALQDRIEELQKTLRQVANEKVKALMELAQLKQDYHRLQEKLSQDVKQGNVLADNGEIKSVQDRDGRLKNIFKKTYLKRWINPEDTSGNEVGTDLNQEGNTSKRISNHSMDFARMKVENAALMESLESMHHLTSSVHRLRFALLKVRDSIFSMEAVTSSIEAISNIMYEAKLLKTALGSSLPVSWSVDTVRFSASHSDKAADVHEKSRDEKVDCVSAAGHEMVELVILASQILLDEITKRDYNNALSSQESSAA